MSKSGEWSAGNGQASVSFTAPASDGGSSITSYTVTSAPGGLTATCAGSPCVATGLTNGTAYTFTVHATNTAGDSAESAASVSVQPSGTPNSPGDVTVRPGNSQLVLSCAVPGDGGTVITGYQVSTDGGLTWQVLTTTTTGGTTSGTVTALTNGTAYTLTVHATNSAGDPPESATSAAITPATVPGTPSAVSVTSGNGQARVTFTPPAATGGLPVSGY